MQLTLLYYYCLRIMLGGSYFELLLKERKECFARAETLIRNLVCGTTFYFSALIKKSMLWASNLFANIAIDSFE